MSDFNWINKPFLDAITYFTGLLAHYIGVARTIGRVMCILCLVWMGIQMIFGTLQARKALVGLITKLLLFFFVINFYQGITGAVKVAALRIGQMGDGRNRITTELTNFKKHLDALVTAEEAGAQAALVEAQSARQSLETQNFDEAAWERFEVEKKRTESVLRASAEKNKKTISAIKTVLIPLVDGEQQGGSYTEKYFLDTELKNSKTGNSTNFISPSAVLRIAVLCGTVMWEKQWTVITTTMEEKKETGNWLAKAIPASNFEMHWLFDMLLTFICMLFLVVATIFALIQYCMTMLEYTIITAVAVIFVPMLLFDGLKDTANKVIPAILGLAIKMLVITVCMYFAMYSFIVLAVDVITENTGMNLQIFAYVAFTVLLSLVLTQNAPQIAVTMLTGNPQLSMGELVHAMATTAAMGAGAAKAMEFGGKTAAGAARGAINTAGFATGIAAAGQSAREQAAAAGIGISPAGVRAAILHEAGSRVGQGLSGAAQDLLHIGMGGGRGAGGSGGSGAGTNRYGKNSLGALNEEHRREALERETDADGKLLVQANSQNFGTAQNKLGQQMTPKEFLEQQRSDAKQRTADWMAKKIKASGIAPPPSAPPALPPAKPPAALPPPKPPAKT